MHALGTPVIVAAGAGGVVLLLALGASLHVVREYERLLVFRFGRLLGARGPGLILTIPIVDRVRRLSVRVATVEIPPLEVITGDDVALRIQAAVLYRVADPARAIVSISDYQAALVRIAQATMRATLGRYQRAALLAGRTTINGMLTEIIDAATEAWGLKVERFQIEDIELVAERFGGQAPPAAPAPDKDERTVERPTRPAALSPAAAIAGAAEAPAAVAVAEVPDRPRESQGLPAWM
jgi:regulator of protease activity HflC (stomatin/prohibitin superfamily)